MEEDYDYYEPYVEAIPIQYTSNMIEDEYIEVTTISDVYKTIEKEVDGEIVEEYELVKSNAKAKQILYKSEISHIKQIFNDRGNVKTKQIELGIKYKDPIVIEGNYNQFKNIIFNQPKQNKSIGYELRR